jgi:hypothetical protein
MKFESSTLEDIQQIQEWTDADEYHHGQNNPAWWITGNGSYLAGCIQDDEGTVLYFRFDREDPLLRLNIQFAPIEKVSKRRVVQALLGTFSNIEMLARAAQFTGLIFASESPRLILFLDKLGFKQEGENFILRFGE